MTATDAGSKQPERSPATDRIELTALLNEYARCVDRRDYATLATLFVADASIAVFESTDPADGPSRSWSGGAEFATRVQAHHSEFRVTTHFLGQHTLALQGDAATGEVYCLAHHLYADATQWRNRVMGIRYQDTYTYQPPGDDGRGWRFRERRLLVDWIEYRPTGSVPTPQGWRPAE